MRLKNIWFNVLLLLFLLLLLYMTAITLHYGSIYTNTTDDIETQIAV